MKLHNGIKFPIDEPCFPILVHFILHSKEDGNTSDTIDVAYMNKFNELSSQQYGI
jgi:hypothetical protein